MANTDIPTIILDYSATPLTNVTPDAIGAIPTSQKGIANGVATTNSDGDVPLIQLKNINTQLATKANLTDLTISFLPKGSCNNASLPSSSNTIGDTYYITDLGCNKTWNGTIWYQSSKDITNVSNDNISGNLWVKYNPLNLDLSVAGTGSTFENSHIFFSQYGAITQKGKIKIHVFEKTGFTNKALLLRKTDDGYFIEKYYSWTSIDGYHEIETPFVSNGSGNQYLALQGVLYTSSTTNVFEQWYDNSSDEYVIIQKYGTDGKAVLQYYISFYNGAIAQNKIQSPLKNKRWAILGDSRSISEYTYTSKHYFEYISESVGGILMENHAVSGARFLNNICLQPDNIKNTPDIITVYGGINDYGQDNPTALGVLGDSSSTSTFYGKLRDTITRLLTYFPSALIVFITPAPQNGFWSTRNEQNELGLTVRDYSEAMKNECGYWGIPVLDNCNESGYSPHNWAQKTMYYYDGLHENATGNERIAIRLQKYLESKLT